MTAGSCARVREVLLRGEPSLDAPDVAAHVATCDACRELVRDRGRLGHALGEAAKATTSTAVGAPSAAELERIFAGVSADVARERGPIAALRSRSMTWRVGAVAALVVVEALVVVGLVPRVDLGIYPILRHAAFIGLLLGIASVAAWESLRPLHAPALPRWIHLATAIGALAMPFVLGMMPPETDHHSLGHHGTGSVLFEFAFYCLVLGAFMGLGVLVVLRAMDRGGHGSGARATLAALAGGLVGTVMVHLHCPLNDPLHLVLGHAPVALMLAAGYALLRR